ncbi:hypothetical protein JCM10207_005633 [Rhodosporidiobolus poonsookiae]
MKPLSLLFPLAVLSSTVLAMPPPDLIESLSAARAAPSLTRRTTSNSSREDGLTGGKHTKQSAPISHGPAAVVLADKDEFIVIVKNGTRPKTLKQLPTHNTINPQPRPFAPDQHNSTAHLLPLDHERLARRLRKRGGESDDQGEESKAGTESVVDQVEKEYEKVKEGVEGKLGLPHDSQASLVEENGKVTGDRHHYWYVDSTPSPTAQKQQVAKASSLVSSAHASASSALSSVASAHAHDNALDSARLAAASQRISHIAKRAPIPGREDFEHAHQAAAARHASRVEGYRATRSSTGPRATAGVDKSKGAGNSAKAGAKSTGAAAKEKKMGDLKGHSKRAPADEPATTSTPGFVTSTRPSTASSAPPTATPSAESASGSTTQSADLLDPSTWGTAITGEVSDQYNNLKKKVDSLDLLSKIGLASLCISGVLLVFALLYCCCKLRIRRRRRRAVERVNASLAASQARGRGATGFEERATSIPMMGFGSSSGSSSVKKGKRRGSWKASD